ncbi:uncharacterized protein LOC123206734 [Mangifera indica]|uniref:uncharacterized protein LOC123206734 n=1 Tax=Mangifera indica TaxID=29780 RepID=UPI001CFB6336|nr:uncharacterized protein LOC123206734 [Mangifera indica]
MCHCLLTLTLTPTLAASTASIFSSISEISEKETNAQRKLLFLSKFNPLLPTFLQFHPYFTLSNDDNQHPHPISIFFFYFLHISSSLLHFPIPQLQGFASGALYHQRICLTSSLPTTTNNVVSRCFSSSVGVEALVTSKSEDVTAPPRIGDDKIGVLLLNLGGPETLEDVQPFLFNLFADP